MPGDVECKALTMPSRHFGFGADVKSQTSLFTLLYSCTPAAFGAIAPPARWHKPRGHASHIRASQGTRV